MSSLAATTPLRTGTAAAKTASETAPGPRPCRLCAGTGWADPWELHDGAPWLIDCDRCLGLGLDDCVDCEGEGAVAVPTPCPCEDDTSGHVSAA